MRRWRNRGGEEKRGKGRSGGEGVRRYDEGLKEMGEETRGEGRAGEKKTRGKGAGWSG